MSDGSGARGASGGVTGLVRTLLLNDSTPTHPPDPAMASIAGPAQPATPPKALPPLGLIPDEGAGATSVVMPLRIAIDLGTSASAVGFVGRPGEEPSLADFSSLGEQTGGPVRPLIGSKIYVGNFDFNGGRLVPSSTFRCCLGNTASTLQLSESGGHYFTSFKRLLEHAGNQRNEGHGEHLEAVLGAVILELLKLALLPSESDTCKANVARTGRPLSLGFGGGLAERILALVPRRPLELCLTMPNSFTHWECEKLEAGALAAVRIFLETLSHVRGWRASSLPAPAVRLVWEAEAVAIWHAHAIFRSGERRGGGRWLVFDVGAGTTDLALVDVHLPKVSSLDERVEVRLLSRAGVPLGGDDTDLLFIAHLDPGVSVLSALRARLGGATLPQLDALPTAGLKDRDPAAMERIALDSRNQLRNAAEALKLQWAGQVADAPGTTNPELLGPEFWSRWNKEILGLGDLARSESSRGGAEDGLLHPLRDRRYGLYVHLLVRGCIDSLFEGDDLRPVDLVILSGRAARLPGLEGCLCAYLQQRGLVSEAAQVCWVRGSQAAGGAPRGADAALSAKLAVVRGATLYHEGDDDTPPAPLYLSDSLWVETDIAHQLEMPRGTPLDADGRCRKLYTVKAARSRVRLGFYRQRLPDAVVSGLSKREIWSSRWGNPRDSHLCRKYIAVLELRGRQDGERHLALEMDERDGKVRIFTGQVDAPGLTDVGNVEPIPTVETVHPVTEMPLDWLWPRQQVADFVERGRHT